MISTITCGGKTFKLLSATHNFDHYSMEKTLENSIASIGDSVNVPLSPRVGELNLGNVCFERTA